MHYKIRDILSYSKEQIANLPNRFVIEFEDINVDATRIKTIYSDFFWDLIREYPNTPILSRHYVDSVLNGKSLSSSTHTRLLGVLYKDILEVYDSVFDNNPGSKDRLLELLYIITNRLEVEMPKYCSEHVTTIDVTDFTNLVTHPIIAKVNNETTNDHQSIIDTYSIVKKELMTNPDFDNNAVAIACRASLVNTNQVLQAIAVRGKLTEVDGSILPTAVLSNFTKGLTDLYEYAAESRSAAKALYFSDAKLQDTEYTARRLQLLTMVVEKLSYEDCGSTRYLSWTIKGPTLDEDGSIVYVGDLPFMKGKYYMDNDNVLKYIRGDEEHLIGTTIRLRSPIYCNTSNQHNVCTVCFGRLSRNISRFQNVGHVCVSTMTQQLTQSVLSTKHLDFTSSGSGIVLNNCTSKYFTTDANKSNYFLKKSFKKLDVKIIAVREEVRGLLDIQVNDNIDSISPIRISAIEHIEISVLDGNTRINELVYLNQNSNKRVVLTKEFLRYLKVNKWKVNSNNNFVFSLDAWDFSLPIFMLPEMEYSFSDHAELIARVIESNMKNIRRRSKELAVEECLQELFMLTNSKIKVNLSILEVIMYACMIKDVDQYGLSRKDHKGIMGIAALNIKNRSLGVAYAYQDIHKTLINPRSFFKLDRPDSIFDVLISPEEYLKYH